MSFDEDDVRRALDGRSAPPSAEFRERLSSALAHGPRRADFRPAFAATAAVVLAVAAVGVLVFARQGSSPKVAPVTKPSPAVSISPVDVSPTPDNVTKGVLTPPPGPIALPSDATLSVPSDNVVWALMVSQYLYRSTDQGRTWQQRPLPPVIGIRPEISFVSASEGWIAVLASPETQCNAQTVEIWHTTDAGATWVDLGSHGIADAQCKAGLSFTDSQHGFIGGWDQNDRPVIYYTTDGGLTWKVSNQLDDPPGFNTQPGGSTLRTDRVRFVGGILLARVVGDKNGGLVQFVYRSVDGATWFYYGAATERGGTLALLTESHWLQLVLPGQSVETTDAGQNWHPSPSDYSQAAPVAPEVDFADSQVGYATVRGEIQLTVDGGQHWTSIKTPGT